MPVTPAPTPTSCSETVIKVKILADDYGSETTWDLINECDGGLVRSGGPYSPNQQADDEFCISAAQYKFTIQDSANDGICCGYGRGNYEVLMDGVSQFVGGRFRGAMEHVFGNCASTPLPVPAPSQRPSPAPTQMPVTPAPTPTSCSETVIKVKILADDYGSETTWDLIDQRDGELVRSGGPYNPNQEVEDEFCISAAQYKFTIQDSAGDGICCGYGRGNYKVLVNGVPQFVGGEFGAAMEHVFGSSNPEPV